MNADAGLKTVLTLTAMTLTLLGGGLVFATHTMAVIYGAAETTAGVNAGRMAGAAILALGILAWAGRSQERRVLRSAVVPVLIVWFAAKSVVAYLDVVDGEFKAGVGVTVFGFDVLLTLVYIYYFVRLRQVD